MGEFFLEGAEEEMKYSQCAIMTCSLPLKTRQGQQQMEWKLCYKRDFSLSGSTGIFQPGSRAIRNNGVKERG
jgi:hypothetical protein